MRVLFKTTLGVIGLLGLLLTVTTHFINTYPDAPIHLTPIVRVLDIIQFPGRVIGFVVSGNVHQPNILVSYAVLWVLYCIVLAAITWIVKFVVSDKDGHH
jgi:hypothetical protein